MKLYEKLERIQQELKAPKGQYNDFGKYSYRSCEDIFEAVKLLLLKYGVVLQTTDELVQIGERYYIKATAILTDVDGNQQITNTAYAREEETKKGMDGSQITGASSSYARKYALNQRTTADSTLKWNSWVNAIMSTKRIAMPRSAWPKREPRAALRMA